MYMSKRHRNYCFTLNNYTTEEETQITNLKCKYIIYGREKGESGTEHLQGFIILSSAKTFSAIKKSLPNRSHIELCKGTPYENFIYCSKDGDIYENGDRPEKVGQGQRKDLLEIKQKISEQVKIKTLLEKDYIQNYQQLQYAEKLCKYYEKPRTWKPVVKWYYGPPQTGKTQDAFEEAHSLTNEDDIYVAMDTAMWFDGYDGQSVVIIDDMRKDFIKFHLLLRLLDRYAYRVQTKGSTRQFVAKHIFITSPQRPEDMYDTREDLGQLLRRIDEIKLFSEKRI